MGLTLIILKPDAVKRNLSGKILSIFEDKGFKLKRLELLAASKEILAEHYKEHEGKTFYEPLLEFMSSGPLIVGILQSDDDTVTQARNIIGDLKTPGTIRHAYATSVTQNVIHASDSDESALREMYLWFPHDDKGSKKRKADTGFYF